MEMRLRAATSRSTRHQPAGRGRLAGLPGGRAAQPRGAGWATRRHATRSSWLAASLARARPSASGPSSASGASRRTGVTLEELAVRLGISKERVRQIEHRALQKLPRRYEAGEGSGRDDPADRRGGLSTSPPPAGRMGAEPLDDVAIVGGGHAGLLAGAVLARLGFAVRIVERQPAEAIRDVPPDGRSLALVAGSLRSLQRFGLWPGLAPSGEPVWRTEVADSGDGTARGLRRAGGGWPVRLRVRERDAAAGPAGRFPGRGRTGPARARRGGGAGPRGGPGVAHARRRAPPRRQAARRRRRPAVSCAGAGAHRRAGVALPAGGGGARAPARAAARPGRARVAAAGGAAGAAAAAGRRAPGSPGSSRSRRRRRSSRRARRRCSVASTGRSAACWAARARERARPLPFGAHCTRSATWRRGWRWSATRRTACTRSMPRASTWVWRTWQPLADTLVAARARGVDLGAATLSCLTRGRAGGRTRAGCS